MSGVARMPGLARLHARICRLHGIAALAVAAGLGIVSNLAFAPFHAWPVILVTFPLLVWLLDGAKRQAKWRKAAFARCWAFGFGFFLIGLHWTAFPFLVDPARHAIFLWMPLILLPGGLALIFGLAGLVAAHLWSETPGRVLILAAALSLAEWLRGTLFGGFPWNWLGTAWPPGSPVSQLAAVFGIWGLTVVTLVLACAPAALADGRKSDRTLPRLAPLLASVIVFAGGWAWGADRITRPPAPTAVSARLVDIGIPQADKWLPENGARTLQRFLELTGPDSETAPQIVVWPESALPVALLQMPDVLDIITERLGNRVLVTGTVRIDAYAEDDPLYYNSLAVLDENSGRSGPLAIYDKNRLVPFGELAAARIIPFGERFSALLPGALQQMAKAGFEVGPPPTPIALPSGLKILPLICYEALFPELVRRARTDADVLVNISTDAWFGVGVGPQQHYAQARYRAIETGRPLLRAASLGETAIVDAFGLEAAGGIRSVDAYGWQGIVVDGTIPGKGKNTIYSRIGDWFAFILCGLLIISGLYLARIWR